MAESGDLVLVLCIALQFPSCDSEYNFWWRALKPSTSWFLILTWAEGSSLPSFTQSFPLTLYFPVFPLPLSLPILQFVSHGSSQYLSVPFWQLTDSASGNCKWILCPHPTFSFFLPPHTHHPPEQPLSKSSAQKHCRPSLQSSLKPSNTHAHTLTPTNSHTHSKHYLTDCFKRKAVSLR